MKKQLNYHTHKQKAQEKTLPMQLYDCINRCSISFHELCDILRIELGFLLDYQYMADKEPINSPVAKVVATVVFLKHSLVNIFHAFFKNFVFNIFVYIVSSRNTSFASFSLSLSDLTSRSHGLDIALIQFFDCVHTDTSFCAAGYYR